MKVLVTGGAGFIGSHLVDLLLEKGHQVIAIDNLSSGSLNNLATAKHYPSFRFLQEDVTDQPSIGPYFEGVDWVFHLAGAADVTSSFENPDYYFKTNVSGTLAVLECAKAHQVKRFVYAASSSCYGEPKSVPTLESAPLNVQHPYGLTKLMGEQLVLHWEKFYQLPTLSLRLFNVYGPRQRAQGPYGGVIPIFLGQHLQNKPLTIVGDGNQGRDFVHVSDVAHAFLAAAESSLSGETFNVGLGQMTSINQLATIFGGEKISLPKRKGDPELSTADISSIQENLGWKPSISLEKGIKQFIQEQA